LPTALILTPTRELAEQICKVLDPLAHAFNLEVLSMYGGTPYSRHRRALARGVDILVACPGRLIDMMDRDALGLEDVGIVVIDEADRMADMGFMPAVRRLLDQTASKRQTMLFSATLDGDVAKLTKDYQRNPVRHEVGDATPDVRAASHVFWNVAKGDRPGVVAEAISAVWPSIVFCRTKHGADRLANQLGKLGVESVAIHGGRSQNQRTRALADFAKGKAVALVASDVAARGIHVDGVASVIHFDPPDDHKTYVHRSGRTARAGEGGVVLSLIQPDQVGDMRKMQRDVGINEPLTAPDAAALRALSPMPTRKRPHMTASVDKAPAPKPVERQSDRPAQRGRSDRAYRSERNVRPAREDRGGRHEPAVVGAEPSRPSFWERRRAERQGQDNQRARRVAGSTASRGPASGGSRRADASDRPAEKPFRRPNNAR
jgi:superfamily II DNA/RNA helicase